MFSGIAFVSVTTASITAAFFEAARSRADDREEGSRVDVADRLARIEAALAARREP